MKYPKMWPYSTGGRIVMPFMNLPMAVHVGLSTSLSPIAGNLPKKQSLATRARGLQT